MNNLTQLRFLLIIAGSIIFNSKNTIANEIKNYCFLAQENNQLIVQKGDSCDKSYSPASSFKIPIALMGFNEGVLINEAIPTLAYTEDFKENFSQPLAIQTSAKDQVNPAIWMQQSIVWYSQFIMEKIGMEKFQNYMNKFHYGNKDISGDKDIHNNLKHNGLIHAWLSGSLKITPQEQINFLQNFILTQNSVVSEEARQKTHDLLLYDDTKTIMLKKGDFSGEEWKGWKLYGKTGTANPLNPDNSEDESRQIGWFVGWIEKGDRKIIFASNVEQNQIIFNEKGEKIYASSQIRAEAKKYLLELINSSN